MVAPRATHDVIITTLVSVTPIDLPRARKKTSFCACVRVSCCVVVQQKGSSQVPLVLRAGIARCCCIFGSSLGYKSKEEPARLKVSGPTRSLSLFPFQARPCTRTAFTSGAWEMEGQRTRLTVLSAAIVCPV